MEKPKLFFYTNMPTPYQLDFFDALSEHFQLTVVYFSAREKDRQWQLPVRSEKYSTILLENNFVAKVFQRYVSSFHYSSKIAAVARKADAEIVIVNGTYWSPNVLLALYFSKSKKRKTAYWGEPLFPVSSRIKKSVKQTLLSLVFRNSDFLLAIGKRAVECYRDYGYKKPLYNIPYNINNSLFETAALKHALFSELRYKYKSKGELIFLSSGSLVRRKGMDTLIKAFLKLPGNYNAILLIIGDGAEKNELVELAGGDNRIQFLGFQEKNMIPYWFNLADVFLFASRYDGWALVINEAMAAGKAIVCSYETGAAYDSLVNRKNAILCAADDTEGFAMAIHELADDEELRVQLAQNAKQSSIELSSDIMAKKIYDIYGVD